ncbi:MAG: alpha/beta fold hydrolase BchO [Pseudomonadota bacterium]
MKWDRDGADWPNRAQSRFVLAKPHRWHVQEAGTGPTLLLLHGAGASTHTWRDLFPDLASDHHVVAIDLPGQGFTELGARSRCGLEPMVADIIALLADQGVTPDAIIGHSAGAVIAAQLALDLTDKPKALICFNGAFGHFRGLAGVLFPMAAKLLSMNPLTAPFFARMARSPNAARNLLASTGSTIDASGVALYQRLISDSRHVDGALAMMAQWELSPLLRRLQEIETPTLLIVGEKDGSVPPDTADSVLAQMTTAELKTFADYGHLLHEEAPALAAEEIRRFLSTHL